MTLTITLAPEVEERVVSLAAEQNLSVEEFVGNALVRAVGSDIAGTPSRKPPASGRELLEKWRRDGVLWRGGMTEDSVEYADKLRERSQRRRMGQS